MPNPKVTLDQWRVLQAVIDRGGYSQAAEYLHRSQSSVSYAVSKLQRQLGVELLYIDGRRARLTEAGQTLLGHARQLLADAVAVEQLGHQIQSGWEAEIRLAVDTAFPTPYLMRVLSEFAPLSKGTRVQLKEVVLSGAEDALLSGEAELVIGINVPPGFLGDLLLQIEFVAVAHPDHRLFRLERNLTSRDLQRELQVVIRDSGAQRRDAGWLGTEHRWTVTSISTALEAIRHGLGFSWLPRHTIADLLARGELRELPLRAGRVTQVPLFLIFARSHDIGPATLQLAELLRRHSGECAAHTPGAAAS